MLYKLIKEESDLLMEYRTYIQNDFEFVGIVYLAGSYYTKNGYVNNAISYRKCTSSSN